MRLELKNRESCRFTSKELDEETGLYYYGARYYEPTSSRWMSADPAGFELINPMGSDGKPRAGYSVIESLNWYSYVSNNPVKYVDPTGMLEKDPAKLAGFAGAAHGSDFGNLKDVTEKFKNSETVFSDDETGFNARLFEAEDGTHVLAFAGANPTSSEDWDTIGRQAKSGDIEGQYEQALELVDALGERGLNSSNLMLTGSSHGGGLAAYAGSKQDINTVTFNASGLHPSIVGPHADKVTNYYMVGDPLTRLQNSTELPVAIGTQIPVSPTWRDVLIGYGTGVVGRGHLHMIGTMQRALNNRR